MALGKWSFSYPLAQYDKMTICQMQLFLLCFSERRRSPHTSGHLALRSFNCSRAQIGYIWRIVQRQQLQAHAALCLGWTHRLSRFQCMKWLLHTCPGVSENMPNRLLCWTNPKVSRNDFPLPFMKGSVAWWVIYGWGYAKRSHFHFPTSWFCKMVALPSNPNIWSSLLPWCNVVQKEETKLDA